MTEAAPITFQEILKESLVEIETKKVYESRAWKRLLVYEKSLFKEESLLRGGDFFLHPEGKRNAQAELQKTLELFLSSEKELRKKYQCKYLARRKFIQRNLSSLKDLPLEDCPERAQWKARLNAQSMSLVFASSYLQNPSSSFGHTFLKLKSPNQKSDLLNYALNFAADTGEDHPLKYALGGLTGAYPGYFSMMPYHQKILEYSNMEGRSLWEFELNFNPDEIETMLDFLWEIQGSHFDYFFLSRNCSYFLLKLFEIGREDLDLTSKFPVQTIPLDTVKIVNEKNLILASSFRPSLKSEFESQLKALPREERKKVKKLIKEISSEPLQPEALSQASPEDLKIAAKYFSIKAYSENEYKKRLHQTNLELSRKSTVESPAELETSEARDFDYANPQESSPFESHDSSQFFFGGYLHQEKLKESILGIFIDWRAAFHDELSAPLTHPRRSHLEILGIKVKGNSFENLEWSRFRLLKVQSIQNFGSSFSSWSWTTEIGYEASEPFIHGGYGIAYDLDLIVSQTWGLLFMGDARSFREDIHRLGLGWRGSWWIDWNQDIRSVLHYDRVFYRDLLRDRWILRVSKSLARNLEFRGENFRQWNNETEWNMGFLINF